MSKLRLASLATLFCIGAVAQTVDLQYGYRTSTSSAPTFVSTNSSIPFQATALGAATTLTFLVNNRGTAPVSISRATVTGEGFTGGSASATSVNPGDTRFFDITFRPTRAGAAAGVLSLEIVAETRTFTSSFFLSSTALAPDVVPSYILNPSGNQTALANGDTIPFNLANLNETSSASVVLTNRGTGRAVLRDVAVTGEVFRITGLPLLPADIAAEREVRFTITFTPTQRTTYRETLRFTVESTTYVVILEGQGVGAAYSYRAITESTDVTVAENGTITLPSVAVASNATARIRVTNNGNANGRINTLQITGTGFSIPELPPLPLTVNAGASFEFVVAFRPSESGRQTGRLRVENAFFDVAGTGIGPRVEFSSVNGGVLTSLPNGGTFNFPNTQVGAKSVTDIRIQNTGNAPASVNSISLNGAGYTITHDAQLPVRLGAGESLTTRVTFAPEAVGSLTGTIQIDDARIQLRGAGTPPTALPPVSITTTTDQGQPLQQPAVRLRLDAPYALPVTGRLTLTFNSETFTDDPSIQFATGGRTVDFRIPENTTEAIFSDGSRQMQFQTGTVAGTIAITSTLSVASVPVTPAPAPSKSLAVAQAEPQLTSVQVASRSATGMDLIITGYSTARSVTTLNIQFTATGTSQIQTPTITQNVDAQFTSWFQNASSRAFGSQFTATLRLNGTGDLSTLQTITVTATNAKGTSRPASVNLLQSNP